MTLTVRTKNGQTASFEVNEALAEKSLIKEIQELGEGLTENEIEKAKIQEAEHETKKEQAIKEAKETGHNVFIRNVGGYDGDARYPGRELGWVNIVEMATPSGDIIESESPSY